MDFGEATFSGNNEQAAGGTPHYLSPDYLRVRRSRGFPGDIWAMGVTMLYVLGKIKCPEKSYGDWSIHKAMNLGSVDHTRMMNWLDFIGKQRAKLDKQSKIESLVFQMLTGEPESRIKAKDIESALRDMSLT